MKCWDGTGTVPYDDSVVCRGDPLWSPADPLTANNPTPDP